VRLRGRLALAFSLALASACSTVDTHGPVTGSWDSHRAQLSALGQWRATGKLALRAPDTSESASFDWRQRDTKTTLRLSGPLGSGATLIESDGRWLEVHRGGEHRRYDLSRPGALRDGTGWELPLPSLPHWLKGLPAPRSGRLERLRQQGWDVQFESYGQFEALWLPTRLLLRSGQTEATVLLRHWQPTAT